MPGLTLIVGGAGSGKTDEVVSRLAARYEADPFSETVVLVPTVRHGDQFRRRLVGRCGVALRLRVETIDRLSRELAPDAQPLSRTLARELLTRTARREIERGPAAYFGPIAGTTGFADLLGAAVDDLLSEATDPLALSEAAAKSGPSGLIALGAIFAAYVSELERRGWLHPAQIALAAAGAVRAGRPTPPVVMLDGFQVFRGSELVLLEALAGTSEVVATLDPDAGARSRYDYDQLRRRFPNAEVVQLGDAPATRHPDVTAGDAADREGQMRAIARQIKQRLTDEPSLRPSDCAVAFRQASPYLSLARQVFEEYDLPLDPAAGERLAARPLGVWLRRALYLARDGWHLRDVNAVLSNGFVDLRRWELSQSHVARFARRGREKHLWAGWDVLQRTVEGLRTDADDPTTRDSVRDLLRQTADGMAAALDELRGLLERPPSPVSEHARRLDEALFGERAVVGAGSRAPGVDVEIEALRGYLRELATTHESLGGEPESFEAFVARLERQLDAPAVLLREAGGVLLAPMHTLHGLRFDFVAVGGLIEGEFPAPQRSTALLDRDARDSLNGAGLDLPPEARLAEDELWESVRTRADRGLGLWRTRLDERDRPAAASYYFDLSSPDTIVEDRSTPPERAASRRELAIACSRQWPSGGRLRPLEAGAWPVVRSAVAVEQLRRSFGHAGVYEGLVAGGLATRLTDENAVWSASRLESYRTCAFQFFAHYALRLREAGRGGGRRGRRDARDRHPRHSAERARPDGSARSRPDAGHFGRGCRQPSGQRPDYLEPGPRGDGLWPGGAVAAGGGGYLPAARDAPGAGGRDERAGRRHPDHRRREADRWLCFPLDPPMRVTATVDRLDDAEDTVVIVDYKSGREVPRAHVMDGRRVQLQLYGYLAREETKAERVIARYAWTDPAISQWALDSSDPEDAAVLEDVVAVAREVRGSVESGDFRVNPQVTPCPTYCSFKHVCRVNELTRWKRWS